MSPRNRKDASLSKRLGWRAEALAYDLVRACLRLLGFRRASALGGWVLRRVGPRTSKHRIVRRNLAIAFPELGESERERVAGDAWENVGRTFFEFPLMDQAWNAVDIRVEGAEHLAEVARPCIVITGHFANWEVMAAVLARSPLPTAITYRRINNPHIDRRVVEGREAYGTKTLVPKSGAAGARHLLETLKGGASVALLNDQKFNTGVSVAFFGEPAMTAPGPVRLAKKVGAPVLLMSCERVAEGFMVRVEPPWTVEDVESGVERVVRWTEEVIRRQPAQWFWPHRRWPKTVYRE